MISSRRPHSCWFRRSASTRPETSSPSDAMSVTRRPSATMMRTRALFAYSCCCAREHRHDAEACCQAWAGVAAECLCPLLVDTGPLLVDIGEGAVGPVRTVDDSLRPALFPLHAQLLPPAQV